MITDDLPLIYIATPLSDADPEGVARNVRFAEQMCRMVSLHGGAPYAPHLLLPRFLDDNVPVEREMGISAGLRMLTHCDEVWAILPPWRNEWSVGMKHEIEAALDRNITVRSLKAAQDLVTHMERLQAGGVSRRVS